MIIHVKNPCHVHKDQLRSLEPTYLLTAIGTNGSMDAYIHLPKGTSCKYVAKRVHQANVVCARVTAQDMYDHFLDNHTDIQEEGRRPSQSHQKRSFAVAHQYKGGEAKPLLPVVGGYDVTPHSPPESPDSKRPRI